MHTPKKSGNATHTCVIQFIVNHNLVLEKQLVQHTNMYG